MSLPPVPDVAGLSLDGDGFMITAAENEALCRSLGTAPDASGEAHPIWSYVATQIGMGLSVAELCAACAFRVEDGPMILRSHLEAARPIMTDRHYRVFGEIIGVTRKQSRKLGAMDLLEYRLRLDDEVEGVICTVTNTWALPRGHDDGNADA